MRCDNVSSSRPIWTSLVRTLLALIFLAAGLLKLGDLATFTLDISNTRMLPLRSAPGLPDP